MLTFPILMYHQIISSSCSVPGPQESLYAVRLDEFVWQMDMLARMGYRGLSLREAISRMRGGSSMQGIAVLTFDDGNRSDFIHALPLLSERGFSATFFVTVSRIGAGDSLEERMLLELDDSGMEIGSHGMTHRFLTLLSEEDRIQECTQSKRILGELVGEVRSFSPPGGRIDKKTVEVLRQASYESICTSRFGYNSAGSDLFSLKRIPVRSDTTRSVFHAILERSMVRLFPLYARAWSLQLFRSVLGEKNYRRLRSTRIKGQ